MGRPTYSSRLKQVTASYDGPVPSAWRRMSSWYAGSGLDPVASPSTAAGFRRTTASTTPAATAAISAADPSGTTSISDYLSSSGRSSSGVPDQGGTDRAD